METLESALALMLSHRTCRLLCRRRPLTAPLWTATACTAATLPPHPPKGPARLSVVGEACAGCTERFHVPEGCALRVMTGAPVPTECDCVVRQEDTDEGMDTVRVFRPVGHGKNVCYAGEDVARGDCVLHQGEAVTAAHIGVLASLGVTRVTVYRRVRAVLLSTGDELMQPGQSLTYGQIFDANRAVLTARLAELGVEATVPGSAADEPETVARLLEEAARSADVLITTGGVSVGRKDIMHRVLPCMGARQLFWKVAMKPGSPLLCGVYQDKLMICLSGNPFAALACFEVFAVPVLRKLAGQAEASLRRGKGHLTGSFSKASPGRRLIRARCEGDCVRLTGTNHSSGSLFSMIGCNCLIDIPAGSSPLQEGDEVEVILL